jgi:hypothetical protein
MNRADPKIASQTPAQGEPPELGGVRLGQTLTIALYFLLLVSAFLALWSRRFPGELPILLESAAPWSFLVFLAAFAFYRLGLMRAGKYPSFKGFFQIGAGLLVFTLMLPHAKATYQTPAEGISAALSDSNAEIRALAAELAGYRPDGRRYGAQLVKALEDGDARVREEAHASLVRLTGVDLGRPGDPAAVERWRKRFP